MADYNANSPGTPEWWLFHLVTRLLDQQERYDILEKYYLGEHPLPPIDPRYKNSMKRQLQMAQTNYVALVANAPVERMKVKGFKFGEGDADEDAKMVWAANDMDLQSNRLHYASSIFGDSYACVGEIDEETGFPTIAVLDPRLAITEPHPLFPTKSLAALRMWVDTYSKRVMAVLELTDEVYYLTGPEYPYLQSHAKNEITTTLRAWVNFDLVAQEPNELGEPSIVRFPWRPDFGDFSFGEFENVLNIQDRINYMVFDRLKIAMDQAYSQRWATKVTPAPRKGGPNSNGPVAPPFENGPGHLWVGPEGAEFGQFPVTDFKQILEAVRDDIADMASTTQTPSHYLMNRMVNVSGDTLTQSESGFISKTKQRMAAMGWGWEKVMRLCFKRMGLPKATEVEASVMWAEPQVNKAAEMADAASKWALIIGAPLAAEHFGDFSADEIIAIAEMEKQKKIEEQQQAQMQHQQAMELGAQKTSAPPGGSKTKNP